MRVFEALVHASTVLIVQAELAPGACIAPVRALATTTQQSPQGRNGGDLGAHRAGHANESPAGSSARAGRRRPVPATCAPPHVPHAQAARLVGLEKLRSGLLRKVRITSGKMVRT